MHCLEVIKRMNQKDYEAMNANMKANHANYVAAMDRVNELKAENERLREENKKLIALIRELDLCARQAYSVADVYKQECLESMVGILNKALEEDEKGS